jgi:Copper type II ascorbate-dependent monooxygenase, C-terminal domain
MKLRARLCRLTVVAGWTFAAVGCSDAGQEAPTSSERDEAESSDDEATPAKPAKDASTTPKRDAGPAKAADVSPEAEDTPDAGTAPAPSNEAKLWCDARAVLQSRCQTCHGAEVAGAPMSLVTWSDTQATSVIDKTTSVAALIKSRTKDAKRPMPPVAQGPLTGEEQAALDAWFEAGYPDGDCGTPDVSEGKPTAEFKWPAECTPDKIFTVKAHQNGQPFNVQADWEDNVSITIPVPWVGKVSGEVQALAIKPLTNNKRVVHHWILYAGSLNFITSWSPGKEAETFPDDVGVYMPSSGSFQLNMHYYNKGNDKAEPDESGAEICITNKLRPKTATTNMFGPFSLSVPPGKSEAVSTCTHSGSGPVTLITSSPHMHKTGVGGKFEILRADGKIEVLDDSPFNQEDQTVRQIDAVINVGDKVRTTCKFENTSAQTKRFGESTEDEMCFNFSRYYPKGALSCRAF